MRTRNLLLIGFIVCVLILSSFGLFAFCSGNGSASDDWAMYRQNTSHTGAVAGNGSCNSAALLWNFTTGRMVQSSPAVAYGLVIFGSRDSQVYCLNASTGEPVWERPIRNEVWSSPTISNMSVYIGADDGYLYCLDITSGMPLWRTPIGAPVRSSPAVANGVVYVGSGLRDLYALNASDGSVVWGFPTLDPVNSSPAFSDGVVYFASGDGYVYAVNGSTGSQVWRSQHFRTSDASSPAVYDGYVYIGSYNGYVYCFNASTGAQVWKYGTADEVQSSPAVYDGRVYVGSEDNSLYCLNASTGNKIWQSSTGYWITSSPAVADGNVYVGSQDYCIYCFNATTGSRQWSYATGDIIESSPAIANNTLYIGSDDSRLYALALVNSTTQIQNSQPSMPLHWTTVAFDTIACVIGAVAIFEITRFVYFGRRQRNIVQADGSVVKSSWFSAHADIIFVLAILSFSAIFFVNLGSGVLQIADEQTYSQWAYHMVKSGDYLTPWAYGAQSFVIGKPPFLMWLMSLAYQVFGVNNFASRIWTAFFGSLSLVLVYYLGKKLYNQYVGFLSSIVLGTFLTYYIFARYAMTDVPLVCFVVASIYFFVLSEEGQKVNRYTVLSGLFFGLALMTKQIAALLIPLIAFGYLLVTNKSIRFLFTKRFTAFWAVGLLVFTPWLIAMSWSFGSQFWQWYFFYSDVARSAGVVEGHTAGFFFYFSYLAHNENWLWLALLPFAAGLCVYNAAVKRLKGDTLVILWMAIVLLVFSLAGTKIYWYIMPVFPAFAFAIASLVYQVAKRIIPKRSWDRFLVDATTNSGDSDN